MTTKFDLAVKYNVPLGIATNFFRTTGIRPHNGEDRFALFASKLYDITQDTILARSNLTNNRKKYIREAINYFAK